MSFFLFSARKRQQDRYKLSEFPASFVCTCTWIEIETSCSEKHDSCSQEDAEFDEKLDLLWQVHRNKDK